MAEQKQDDQHEHTFSNYVRIRDVVQKTCQRRWTIGKSGERGSEISVPPARHYYYYYYYYWFCILPLAHCISLQSEWRQVSSSLQDSFEYSSRSYQFFFFCIFSILLMISCSYRLFKNSGSHSKRTTYSWHQHHPDVLFWFFFQFFGKVLVYVNHFSLFHFHSLVRQDGEIY